MGGTGESSTSARGDFAERESELDRARGQILAIGGGKQESDKWGRSGVGGKESSVRTGRMREEFSEGIGRGLGGAEFGGMLGRREATRN